MTLLLPPLQPLPRTPAASAAAAAWCPLLRTVMYLGRPVSGDGTAAGHWLGRMSECVCKMSAAVGCAPGPMQGPPLVPDSNVLCCNGLRLPQLGPDRWARLMPSTPHKMQLTPPVLSENSAMAWRAALLLLVLRASLAAAGPAKQRNDFDLFVFVRSYSPTFCRETSCSIRPM